MVIRSVLFGLLTLGFLQSAESPGHSPVLHPITTRSLDSSAMALRKSYAMLTSPELERRKARRRGLQQQGYANVLRDVLAHDGFGALISYIRLKAQLDFHLPHHTLFVYANVTRPGRPGWEQNLPGTSGAPSGPVAIALYEDFTFPADPWNKAK